MYRSVARSQRGDTIVEVLIAMVVVSTVLIAAFAISNMSLKQIRMAQERSEAQHVAEQSVESLDRMVLADSSLLSRTTPFCKNGAGLQAVAITDPSCRAGTDSRYKISIVRTGAAPSYSFAVTITWDGLKGTQEKLVLNYRVDTK